jgi:HK97 family phage portal protein
MGFFDFLRPSAKNQPIANISQNLPLPTVMRGQNYLSGIGLQDLFANLSRRLPNTSKDWQNICGDLMLNSIVAISMDYYIRGFSQALPMVYRLVEGSDSEYEKYPDHPMIALISNPQYQLAPTRFWSNCIIDYKIYGNVYIRKIRKSKGGPVIGLQFLPSQQCQPVGDNINPITHYNYVVDGTPYAVSPEDIIHIAYGRDPIDYRLGRSPLMSVLREIATDNVASSCAFGLMNNSGLPSIMVSPDATDQIVDISDDDLRTMKRRLEDSFTGDNAGSIAVMSGPFKVEKVSFSPNEMALDSIRHTPEERISSAMGLNCMVLNLSAGLENSTYSNMFEAEAAAWNQGIIPLLTVFAESITQNLLGEFPETQEGDFYNWDLSKIKALQDDSLSEAKRAETLYKSGIIDRSEAKRIVGYDYNATDEEIYHPQGTPISTQNPNSDVAGKSMKASYKPNASMVTNAKRALKWKDEGRDGGTIIGLTRANQIVNEENLSEDTVVRMYSFFSRHEVDKKAEGFNSGEQGYPSNGRVAWDLWGGDAGFTWSKNIVDKLQD